jgi:hypothetical protein
MKTTHIHTHLRIYAVNPLNAHIRNVLAFYERKFCLTLVPVQAEHDLNVTV